MKTDHAGMHVLGDRDRTVDAPTDDIRGRKVEDGHGDTVGTVADPVVDDREKKVRFLLVDQSRDRIASAPGYDPDLVDDRPYQEDLYAHYGCTPHWGKGYAYPFMGLGMSAFGSGG